MDGRVRISLLALLANLCFVLFSVAAEPASPDIAPDAKKILDYMAQLPTRYSRRIMSGQQLGAGGIRSYADLLERPRPAASRAVALIGVNYGNTPDASGDIQSAGSPDQNRMIKEHWRSGGLVMISFDAKNPWTGGNSRDIKTGSFDEPVSSGTSAHDAWIRELDAVAATLADLRDEGVVVLWRPFHDMNGSEYWWGKREEEPFRKEGFVNLWRHMFDYLTRTKHLNNLLWVYSASSSAHKKMSATAFFPGKEYCDIVALDHHSTEILWDGYNEMAQLGKPFGAIEAGPAPGDREASDDAKLMARIKYWYPLSTFLLLESGDPGIPVSRDASGLLTDPWILSKSDLDWRAPGHLRWKQSDRLAIRKVELLTKEPACWKRVDLRIDLAAAYETPFDPDQIALEARFTTPSGKSMTVPAFFDQPFERQVWGSGKFSEEVMREAGPPEWRLRFMPSEPGEYRLVVRARDRSGFVESTPAAFAATPGAGPGYIKVSGRDHHYFEFDDGTPFFAIGLNMAEHPLSEYYRYIPRLAANGGNFSRLWIGFDYFALERGTMGDYHLDGAWRLDQVMELSEQSGIYQKFCIDWIRHITPRGEPRKNFDREDYAYSISNGGPCNSMRDFFTLPEARRLFKNRLRYIVARWGYSPNVMAWELWNEIDLVDPKAREAAVIGPWNQEMCRYLRSIDPWQHLTTNSLSGRELGSVLWPMDENMFAQRHGYSTPRPEAVLASADMAGNVSRWLDDVAGFDKPYLMAEFGLQRDRMDVRALCDRDQDGVHMHDGIWAAIAHGAAGTAQLWWWGQYVDPKDLYRHFRAVANFAKDIPWTTAAFSKAEIQATNENLRALGLRGNRVSIFWLQNISHTWWNVINGAPIPPVEPSELAVAGYPAGDYRVEFWDSYTGRISGTASATATAGTLRFRVPEIETDMAVKIEPK